jgi:hypothetical protein
MQRFFLVGIGHVTRFKLMSVLWRHSARSLVSRPRSSCQRFASGEGSAVETKVETVDEPIPLLQRPLGVPERPTTVTKTWTDKRNELMNQDIRLAQRKHLFVH